MHSLGFRAFNNKAGPLVVQPSDLEVEVAVTVAIARRARLACICHEFSGLIIDSTNSARRDDKARLISDQLIVIW